MQINAFICSKVLIGNTLLYKILKTVGYCLLIRFIYFNCYSTSALCIIILIFCISLKVLPCLVCVKPKTFRRYLIAIKLNWRTKCKHNETFEKYLYFFQSRKQKNGLYAKRPSITLREICCHDIAIHIDLFHNSTKHHKW